MDPLLTPCHMDYNSFHVKCTKTHISQHCITRIFHLQFFFHFRFTTPNFKRTQETSNESTKTIFCCRISEIKIGALLFRSHRKINHHRSTFLFSARSSALSHTLPRSTIPPIYLSYSIPHPFAPLLTLRLSLAYTSFFMAFRCQSRIFRIGENLCQYDLVACARNKSFIRKLPKAPVYFIHDARCFIVCCYCCFFSFNDDVDIVVDVGIGVSILQFSIEIRFSFHLVESSTETPQKANTP